MDDLVSDFIAETREGLEALDSQLVRFEQCPDDPATLGEIFRLIHTIKGTCGFLGLPRLQNVAHAAENVLGGFRDATVAVTPTAVSAVLDTVDLIRALTGALGETGAEPDGDDTVLIARLDAVLSDGPLPAPAEAPADNRKLIERLGGDSTIDAAVENALAELLAAPAFIDLFGKTDPDRLQAAVRDSLCEVARGLKANGALAAALDGLAEAPLAPEIAGLAFDSVASALISFDVDAAAIDALRQATMAAAPAPAPQDVPTPQAAAGPAPAPAVSAAAATTSVAAAPAHAESSAPAQTIRVSVDALEHLMTVASELVLIRNQLIQTLRLEPESAFAAPLNRLNQVTSELQEGVMTTRMQPISGAWAKLPRLVRDLAQDLNKSIELVTFGEETELDRQVLELIKDPLTHMVRNAADHGLETPEERRAAGKSDMGRITLEARHEGGAIVIEITDDGRGIPADKIRKKAQASGLITPAQAETMSDAEVRALIFMPGLSTAAEVTSISGRGVGMDVVRTNIEKIGGVIEVSSVEGVGSRFIIRIPLTLTIVSALIVECCGDRFAMPQSSIVELVSASDGSGRTVEYIDGAAVLRLRDRLLPLVSLQSLLNLQPAGEPAGETCIVVARVGSFTFGVIVDRVFDTEEIVVKPVATVLRHIKLYSGATILGDGSVILILDLKGISIETGAGQAGGLQDEVRTEAVQNVERSAILVFRAANDALKATPVGSVARIEEIGPDQIERVDGRSVTQYRGRLMPIVGVDAQPVEAWPTDERRPLLVFGRDEKAIGLLVAEIVDIVESTLATDLKSGGSGSLGSLIISGVATELIDVSHFWRQALDEEFVGANNPTALGAPPPPVAPPVAAPAPVAAPVRAAKHRLLIIDQSPFSRLMLHPLLSQAGYEVEIVSDPAGAMAIYEAGDAFSLIMADISNPQVASGFVAAFSRADRWHATPVMGLALSTADHSELLETVSQSLSNLRGAA